MKLLTNDDGTINTMLFDEGKVDFRDDKYSGFKFYTVIRNKKYFIQLNRCDNKDKFKGQRNGIKYSLEYISKDDVLCIKVVLKNTTEVTFKPTTLGLKTGIDTYMEKYPDWNKKYFPTMLRGEKTHFWGYCMTPEGDVIGIGSKQPISSWSLDYNEFNGEGYLVGGHRIFTFNLDLINRAPVPKRHKLIDQIKPLSTMTWEINLKRIKKTDFIKFDLSRLCKAPMIDFDKYTLDIGEKIIGEIYSTTEIRKIILKSPSNKKKYITFNYANGKYNLELDSLTEYGVYTIDVYDVNNKVSQAMIYVKKPWSWYMVQARKEIVRMPPIYTHHLEAFNSLFTIELSKKHFPDSKYDDRCNLYFENIVSQLYNENTKSVNEAKWRIQDSAGLASVMAIRFKNTGNRKDLIKASYLADYIVSCQKSDGAYYSNNKIHYTSVTYIAKYIMDVSFIEKEAAKEHKGFDKKADYHYLSAVKAVDNLVANLDNIETEGELTYEDGMISCSMLQIAFLALHTLDKIKKQQYIKAAEILYEKHKCLTELEIPDCRINGATLRWWEAQYNVHVFSNMMNTPCGWTAWKIYGTWYLYLLTGKEKYLYDTYNGLGSCMQLVDINTRKLRWGFITDPHVKTQRYVQTKPGEFKGKIVDDIISEQYLDMVSDWHREEIFPRKKWCIDNLVYEIFKCLEEVALTKCCVIERENGKIKGFNCKIHEDDNILIIQPSEKIVTEVHFNLKSKRNVKIEFDKALKTSTIKFGFVKFE